MLSGSNKTRNRMLPNLRDGGIFRDLFGDSPHLAHQFSTQRIGNHPNVNSRDYSTISYHGSPAVATLQVAPPSRDNPTSGRKGAAPPPVFLQTSGFRREAVRPGRRGDGGRAAFRRGPWGLKAQESGPGPRSGGPAARPSPVGTPAKHGLYPVPHLHRRSAGQGVG